MPKLGVLLQKTPAAGKFMNQASPHLHFHTPSSTVLMKKYSPRTLDIILKNCDIKLGVLFTHLTINIIGQNQPYNGKTTHLFSCALSCISSSYLVSRKMAGEQLQNVRFEEPFLMAVDQSLLAADED